MIALPATLAPPPPPGPRVVYVTATDYRLALPDTLPAGATTFRVVNRGRELHHVLFVRLAGGHSAADLAAP